MEKIGWQIMPAIRSTTSDGRLTSLLLPVVDSPKSFLVDIDKNHQNSSETRKLQTTLTVNRECGIRLGRFKRMHDSTHTGHSIHSTQTLIEAATRNR